MIGARLTLKIEVELAAGVVHAYLLVYAKAAGEGRRNEISDTASQSVMRAR